MNQPSVLKKDASQKKWNNKLRWKIPRSNPRGNIYFKFHVQYQLKPPPDLKNKTYQDCIRDTTTKFYPFSSISYGLRDVCSWTWSLNFPVHFYMDFFTWVKIYCLWNSEGRFGKNKVLVCNLERCKACTLISRFWKRERQWKGLRWRKKCARW